MLLLKCDSISDIGGLSSIQKPVEKDVDSSHAREVLQGREEAWHTGSMRAYLPLIVSELMATEPPKREIMKASVGMEATSDDREAAFEDVLEDAAFVSLQLLQDHGTGGGRVVAVGDLPDTARFFDSWNQMDSLMADGAEGTEIVQTALATMSEDEANGLVEALFEEPLEWFDISERSKLASGKVEDRHDSGSR